jgi:TP901 family phage tail tape measure protein
MADAQANINVSVNTAEALSQIRALQRQISAFHTSMAQGGALANAESAKISQNLVNSINAGGKFSASMTNISSSTESFTNALEKNKLSMGQYFRYAGGASKSFGKMFTREFDTINRVATERVKDLQTQYISMGRNANGALQSIKVRPLALDMDNLGTKVMLASQKQQIFNQLLKQGTTNLLNFGKNTQWAGRQLMVGFTIPLTIFGVTAAKEFQKIEEQVVKFRRVYGDMFSTEADTEKALKNVKELAEEFTKYGVAIEKTIGLAAKVAQMGNTGKALTEQVTQATRLAILGGLDQEEALDTTISLTNAFGIAAEELAGKIAFLNAAENQTILAIEDFNTAIPLSGSVVRQLGGDVEDLAVLLTAMREGGINASQAGNALKSSLGRLIAPSRNAKETLGSFGIDVLGIVNNNAGDLMGTINTLAFALEKLDPLDRARSIEALFGKFQFARMSTMFQNIVKEGSQANKVLQLTTATTEELAIVAERELKRVEESPAFKLQKQMEQLKASLAPIGEEFVKAVGPLIEFGTKLLKSFNSLGDGGKQFLVVLTAIAGVIAPAALMAFGLIANGVANLLKFFAFLGRSFGMLSGKSTLLGGQTEYMTQQQIEAAAVAASLGQSHNNLTQIFTAEASAIRNLTTAYQQAAIAQGAFRGMGGTFMGRSGGPAPKPSVNPFLPPKLATGGIIRGPGTGTSDSIMAMLSNGEAVIPAAVVKENPEAINQLIAGNIPGYAKGNADELALKTAKTVTGNESPNAAIVKIMKEQIQRRVDKLGDSLEDAAQNVSVAFDGISEEAKKFAGKLKKSSQYAEHKEEVFAGEKQKAHLGPSGKTVSSTDAAVTSPGRAPLQAMAKLESVTGKTYGVQEKHSWVKSMGAVSNLQMGTGVGEIPEMVANNTQVGRSGDLLLEEFKNQTVDERADSYEEGVTAAGGDIQDPDTRAELVKFDQRIQQLLKERLDENANLLVLDTQEQIDALPKEMQGNYASMEELEAQAAKDVLEGSETGKLRGVALEVPREHRVSKGVAAQVGSDAAAALAEGEISQAEYDSIQTNIVNKKNPQFSVAKKDQKRIREGLDEGLDADQVDVSEAREIGQNIVDSTANAMNAAAEASSPAKRFVRIGENIVNSTAMGMEGEAAEQQGKPSLPGNLAPPPPPVASEVEQSRAGKLFSSLKGKAATVGNKAMDMALETGPGKKVANYFAETSGADITNSQGKVVSTLHQEIKELGDAADRAADQVEENTQAVKENGKASSGRAKGDTAVDSDGNPIIGPDGKPLTNKQIQNESKRQKRQKRAGVAAGIMGTATMAVGMATQVDAEILGFNVGELAQKLMPLIGAVAILGPMLLAMSGPVALVVLALVGIGAAYMAYQAQLKKVTEAARELGESLGAGAKAMGTFAEVAGKATATEIMTERRSAGTIGTAIGKSDFGETFVAGDQGKQFVESIKNGMQELGRSDILDSFTNQLATAVYSNVLTREQASGIAVEVGRAIGDLQLGIEVAGELMSLVGPDGKDILTNGLEIPMNLIALGGEDVQENLDNMLERATAIGGTLKGWFDFSDEEAQARLAGSLVAYNEQLQQILDAQELQAQEREKELRDQAKLFRQQGDIAKAEEASAAADKVRNDFLSDRNALLQEFAVNNQKFTEGYNEIANMQQRLADFGDAYTFESRGGTADELRQLLKDFSEVSGVSLEIDIDSANFNDLRKEFARLKNDGSFNELNNSARGYQKTLEQMGQVVKDRYKDNEEVATQIDNLLKTSESVISFEVKTRVLTDLGSGVLNVGEITKFFANAATEAAAIGQEEMDAYTETYYASYIPGLPTLTPDEIKSRIIAQNQRIQEAYASISGQLGGGAAQQFVQTMNLIDDKGTQQELSFSIQAKIDAGELDQATNIIETMREIASIDSQYLNPEITVDFYLNNPDELTDYQETMQKFEDFVAEHAGPDGTIRHQSVIDQVIITDPGALAIFKADQEYFDSLDPFQQSVYLRALLTVEDTFGAEEFAAWQAKNPWVAYAGIDVSVQYQMAQQQMVSDVVGAAIPKIDGGELTPPGSESGSGSGPQLDSLLKKLRDVRDASISLKKGWEGMQQVLQSVFQGGTTSMNMFDGLSNQIRSIAGFSVGEGLIEYIVGMDPDEYEKRKNELFIFENGNIVGVTGALKNLQSAFNAIAVGEYVNTQEKSISNIQDQIDAIKILTTNGLTYAESLKIVQDQEIATAIAKGATQAEINKTIKVTRELMNLRGDMEKEEKKSAASEAVRKTNKDFEQREKLLKKLATTAGQYSDAQISAILNDSNLQELFLEPSIDQDAFDQAIANAELSAEVELQIKLSTVEGMKSVIDEGLSKAMEAFAAQEQEIELNFQLDIANDESIIRSAQSAISAIQFEIDDLQAELTRIGRQEEEINEAYDKRIDALEKIEKINQEISAAQKSQLDIADALSKGDVAAAARAIQQARAERAKAAAQSQKEQLERARELQLDKLVGKLGLTREQLENQIKDLEEKVFDLEEDLLEPAQERIRLAQELRDEQVRSLEVLGKTRDEWDRIRNNVDLAQANSSKFVSSIQNALDNVEKLIQALGPLADQASGTSVTNASSGGAVGMSGGGMIIPKRMAMGGRVKGYRMGGLIPYKANGGFFKSLGSDTIPAMLTPGEFVVRRPAVKDFGVDNLESINRGTYSSGSVYNYNLNVNVKSDSNANDIARTVIAQIKRVDSQRIRGNRF